MKSGLSVIHNVKASPAVPVPLCRFRRSAGREHRLFGIAPFVLFGSCYATSWPQQTRVKYLYRIVCMSFVHVGIACFVTISSRCGVVSFCSISFCGLLVSYVVYLLLVSGRWSKRCFACYISWNVLRPGVSGTRMGVRWALGAPPSGATGRFVVFHGLPGPERRFPWRFRVLRPSAVLGSLLVEAEKQ